jgi:hypothetical protein
VFPRLNKPNGEPIEGRGGSLPSLLVYEAYSGRRLFAPFYLEVHEPRYSSQFLHSLQPIQTKKAE